MKRFGLILLILFTLAASVLAARWLIEKKAEKEAILSYMHIRSLEIDAMEKERKLNNALRNLELQQLRADSRLTPEAALNLRLAEEDVYEAKVELGKAKELLERKRDP